MNTAPRTASLSEQEIAKRIKARRAELNMSLQQLGDLTGITKSTLSRYETGYIRSMPFGKASSIARALGVSEEWLLGTSQDARILRDMTKFFYRIFSESGLTDRITENFDEQMERDLDELADLTARYLQLNAKNRALLTDIAQLLLEQQKTSFSEGIRCRDCVPAGNQPRRG